MLTPPTGITLQEYTDAIRAGNETKIYAYFVTERSGGSTVVDSIESESFESNALTIRDVLNGDTTLSMGKAVTKEVTLSLLNKGNGTLPDKVAWTDEFSLQLGVDINGTFQKVNLGYFRGTRPEKTHYVDVITLVAYDRMQLFEVDADPCLRKLNSTVTISSLLSSICSYCGVSKVSGDELPNIMVHNCSPRNLVGKGLTCKDIVALIAEASGTYAKITASGQLKLVWYTDNTSYTVPADYELGIDTADIEEGMVWSDLSAKTWEDLEADIWADLGGYNTVYNVDGLNVRSSDSDIGVQYGTTAGNQYYIIDNPFLATNNNTEANNYIRPIYERLRDFGGHLPINLECVGNWLVEAGDIITVDVRGESVAMPIFTRTLRWNGGTTDQYEVTGELSPANLTQPVRQKLIESGRYHDLIVDIEQLFSEIADADGNISSLQQTAAEFIVSLANKYGIISGISITSDGIEITGAKFLKLASTGTFDIACTDFIFDSSNKKIYIAATGFKLDSANKSLECGNWKFCSNGAFWASGNYQYSMANSSDGMQFIYDNQNTGASFGFILDTSGNILPWRSTSPFNYPDIGSSSKRFTYGYFGTINTNNLVNNSSRTVKHDIKPLPSVGDKLDKLKPVSFVYNDDIEEETRFGLIFEDTQDVIPEICVGDAKIKPEEAGIDYVTLVPLLLKEIQDLRKRVADLEARIQ